MVRSSKLLGIILALLLSMFLIYGVCNQVRDNYLQKDDKLQELKELVLPLFKKEKFNSDILSSLQRGNILDEVLLLRGEKSYTINKEKIYICLKDDNGEYYDNNMLIYVLLHECGHVLCDEIGHTEKFHNIFEELLKEATEMGIYDPKKPIDMNYCENGDNEMK